MNLRRRAAPQPALDDDLRCAAGRHGLAVPASAHLVPADGRPRHVHHLGAAPERRNAAADAESGQKVEQYFFTKEKDNVVSVFSTVGSGPGGNGQNVARMFVRLKDWDERDTKRAPRLPLLNAPPKPLTN
jgi:multidrug efflux pump subunit AcrB